MNIHSGDLQVTHQGDLIVLSWSLPHADYSRVVVKQCHDDVMTECIEHDVTSDESDGALVVSSDNGTRCSLLVYQDRDEVVRLLFTQKQTSDRGEDWCIHCALATGN